MPFLKRTTSGLIVRYEFDRSEFPFSTGDWTEPSSGTSISVVGGALRAVFTGAVYDRFITADGTSGSEHLIHGQFDVVSGGGDVGFIGLCSDRNSQTGIECRVPNGYSGVRRIADWTAGGATTIDSTSSVNVGTATTKQSMWADDTDAALYDLNSNATESGAQVNNPHTGEAGLLGSAGSTMTVDIKRFIAMSGRYISVSGLASGQVGKLLGWGVTRSIQTVDTDTAGAPGTITLDALEAEFPFVSLAIYESDGTTLVAVVEDCYGGDVWALESGPNEELTITNPGAESGSMTGWTSDGKSPTTSAQAVNPHTGSYSFVPNSPITGESYSYQDVAIPSGWEADVDAGSVRAALLYWTMSSSTAGCQARVWLAFYDSVPALISTSDTAEFFENAVIAYFPRGQVATVPTLTRYVRIFLWGAKGTAQGKRMDDVELHLLGLGPDTPTVTVDPDAFFADVTGSAYSHSESKPHQATQWQVDTDSAFPSPDYDETDTYVPGAAPASPQHRAAPLLASQAYYARARYQDDEDEWSGWSPAKAFTTDAGTAPDQPTLSSVPSYDSVQLTSSAWTDGRDHVESEWEVDESGGDYSTPVAQSLNNPTDLETIYLSGLTASTAYIARVRHRADDGSYSAWSSNESFSTIADPASKPDQPTLTVADVHTRSADFTSTAFNYPSEPHTHAETRLEVSEDNSFPADSDTFVYSFTPGSTAYSADALATATLYYARVRYRANDGVWSAWSTTKSFTTDDDLMGATILKLVTPRHGAVVSGAAVEITGEPTSVGGATFALELSSDDGETYTALANPSTLPYEWDTTGLTDGPSYVIRGRWTDGVDWSDWEYRHVIVDNGADERVYNLPWLESNQH
jgi:hypothetical protein